MKKYIALLALAGIILATGCASGDTSSTAIALDHVETEIAVLEPDIAFLTREAPTEPETPPQTLVTYSGNGLASAAVMTLGSYEWNYQGANSTACSAGPLRACADGLITAVVDLDLVSENEPKIQLGNAEITGAQFYPLDESESFALDYTPDGSISFPSEAYSGVAVVSLSFEQGNADYYFAVTRSQTDPSQPPELYLYSNGTDIGLHITKCGYTWTVEENGEAWTASVDCATPWQLAQENKLCITSAEPESLLKIGLPENARMISAVRYLSEDETEPLEWSGNTITAQESGICCITVEMPQGTCDYAFQLATGDMVSVPAQPPEPAQSAEAAE